MVACETHLEVAPTAEVLDLRRRLAEATEGLDDYAAEVKTLRDDKRRLEARLRTDEAYENEVAKLLVAAGAPEVVHPIDRVKWAAARLVETRPISDQRVALILRILENLRDSFHRESWLGSVNHHLRDIENVLKQGTHIGRDDGPYQAARRIADNSRLDNVIGEWFGVGSDGVWRVKADVLTAHITQAIEDHVALATEAKTALLVEIAGAMTYVDEEATYDGSGRRLGIAVLVPGPGVDDSAHRDDLLARITTTVKGRTS